MYADWVVYIISIKTVSNVSELFLGAAGHGIVDSGENGFEEGLVYLEGEIMSLIKEDEIRLCVCI